MERSLFKEICVSIGVLVVITLFVAPVANAETAPAQTGNLPGSGTPVVPIAQPKKRSPFKQVKFDPACHAAPHLKDHLTQPIPTHKKIGDTRINADKSQGTRTVFTLKGNVKIIQDDQQMSGDTVVVNKPQNRIDANGNVVLSDPNMVIKGESGFKQIKGDKAQLNKIEFYFKPYNARGSADEVNIKEKNVSRFRKATYTTCKPGHEVWKAKAGYLKLDRNKGRGLAKNVTIRLKNIPVVYLPVISFPIDKRRKTGFLLPSFGSSTSSGAEVQTPFYWNISPNRDMTITPRHLEKRGFQLNTEYRYLHKGSTGVFRFEYLPEDNITKEERYLWAYQQKSQLNKHWSTDVNINQASDGTYLTDFSRSIYDASTTQLERRVDLNYISENWRFLARAQNFQALAGISEVYQRMPQFMLAGDVLDKRFSRITYHFYSELVQFEHRTAGFTTGARLDVQPGISFRVIDHPGIFLTPKFSARYTTYQLDNFAGDDTPERALPIFSLDSGMYFDRNFTFRSNRYQQTLEPRIFYLYVPYKDQSNLPVFDSNRFDFDINQLFRENRFSGGDRQGDANQVTVALTTRFINQGDGRERFRATIGQIYYFENRQVALPGEPIQTRNDSDAVAEIEWSPTKYQHIKASTQWDTSETESKLTIFEYQYRRDKNHLFNLAYRYRENNIEQTDISGIWGITKKWNAIARWNYSLRDETTIDGLAGVEYNNCCWAIRLVARQYIRDINADKENSIHFQFVLKGLGNLGDSIDDLFKQSIVGYQDTLLSK